MDNMLPWLLMVGVFSGIPTGYTQMVKGPRTISGFLGRSLSVRCQYSMGYQNYVKYWCKGADWNSCTTVLKTDGSEREAKAGRTAIQDNQGRQEFIVTLNNLTENDAGSYWCAIERPGADSGFLIDITVLPGYTQVVKGPPTISGFLGRSISVRCQYREGFQNYVKYWCKGAMWSSCTIVLKTDGSEKEAKAGRTAIKDNQGHREIIVTLNNFTENDAGSYWCAIERTGADSGFLIDITLLPGPSISSGIPRASTHVYHWNHQSTTVPSVPEETTAEVPSSYTSIYTPSEATLSSDSVPSSNVIYVPFLIMIGLKATVFLSLISAIIWVIKKNKMALVMKSPEKP